MIGVRSGFSIEKESQTIPLPLGDCAVIKKEQSSPRNLSPRRRGAGG